MKALKYIALLYVSIFITSCDVDYFGSPNSPEVVPTYGLMNRVQKRLMDDTRDEWFSGRQALLWVQYWNQVNYTEEDRFQYRETTNKGGWEDLYGNAQDIKDIITLNEASELSNTSEIAAARIMLVYIYQLAVETWGDVPYYSYGSTNPDFQANMLKSDATFSPKYATQEDIYEDMLNELKEAEAALTENIFEEGDNFFGGDYLQWKKFANSLRLRIANRIKDVYPDAQAHITEAIANGVMTSNDDNAGVQYENNATNGAPMYSAFYVDNRTDFAPSYSFVELLKGNRGTFTQDPRLGIFVDKNDDGEYLGIPLTSANSIVTKFTWESLPGEAVLAADYTEIYMEYSEVCFILSETNNWDQSWYEKGVRASMTKWGVETADIDAFIATLPAASEENVMTQKYIALYMQPYEAWSEYRRTGFPNTLIKVDETYDYTWSYNDGTAAVDTTATFTYSAIGGLTETPSRIKYLLNEASINDANVKAATTSMGGDEQDTKLWWQP